MTTYELSKKKRWFFRLATVVLLVVLISVFAEIGLRYRHSMIQQSDRLQAGLVVPDPVLGWKLAPAWTGGHTHHDFTATYEVDVDGGRKDPAPVSGPKKPQVAVLGDSFTFGLGVADGETFLSLMNRDESNGFRYLNRAVPGYSTDQQSLQLEMLIKSSKPAAVLLVVYLANDLLDNNFGFPIQLNAAKPYYELLDGKLSLRNSPVPDVKKGPEELSRTLMSVVLGEEAIKANPWFAIESRSMLVKTARQALGSSEPWVDGAGARLRPMLHLFEAIVDGMNARCEAGGVPFGMVLLSGRSLVEEPRSLSGRYQEFFRREIASWARNRHISMIDVSTAMKALYQSKPGRWYFAHDGHLNQDGHRVVAGILRQEIVSLPGFRTKSGGNAR